MVLVPTGMPYGKVVNASRSRLFLSDVHFTGVPLSRLTDILEEHAYSLCDSSKLMQLIP